MKPTDDAVDRKPDDELVVRTREEVDAANDDGSDVDDDDQNADAIDDDGTAVGD